ncbi:MAG TPA: GNAT family N-acetyltransferase [Kofleriaceae bacterium]|nr:GNAT family N-acetyltransferase [Kofleriaceae bacterium]
MTPPFPARVEIRPAEPHDDARCRLIHGAATMSSYGQVYRWLEPIVCDPATPLEPCEWSLVAELDGRVVGYVAVTGNHIENLFVLPEAQGQGIGRALLAAVEQRVIGPVTLRCLYVNRRARALYGRHGFVVAREEDICFHGCMVMALFMVKLR